MMKEVETFGQTLIVETTTDLVINEDTFDPRNLSKRPKGWADLKLLRFQAREHMEISNGADERFLLQSRAKRDKEV
jgi:hypothetical protein